MPTVGRYGDEALLSSVGTLLPNTAVTVLNLDSTNATLYTDGTGSTIGPNPVNTNTLGNLFFFAVPATYQLKVGGSVIAEVTVPAVNWNGGTVTTAAYFVGGPIFDVLAATGVAATDKANVSAALTAAMAAPFGGIVRFGPGQYNVGNLQILLPEWTATSKQIILQGSGMISTVLYFSVDNGSGQYAIAGNGATTGLYYNVIQDMSITGPGTRGAINTSPALQDGIRWDTYSLLSRVFVQYFHHGTVAAGNHMTMRDCEVTNNYRACYFNSGTDGGNVMFDNCILAGNLRSSIGIANTSYACFMMVLGHMGFSPYCIDADTGASGTAGLYNCEFFGTAWEQIGNCAIYSSDQSLNVNGLEAHGAAFSRGFATYGISTQTYNPMVMVGSIKESAWYCGMPIGGNDGPCFDVTGYFQMIADQWTASYNQSAAYGQTWMKVGLSTPPDIQLSEPNANATAFVILPYVAVSAGQVLEWKPALSYRLVQPWGTNGTAKGRYAGIALNAAPAYSGSTRQSVVVLKSIDQANVLVDSAAASSYHVVPSTVTTGMATGIAYDGTTATTNGRPLIGEAFAAAVPTGGGTVAIHIIDGPG